MRKVVTWIVDLALRAPYLTLLGALLLMLSFGGLASRLEVRSDLLELLPRDSPGVKAFEHQLGRVGGGSTLIVIVQSPDVHANERFIDDLASMLDDPLIAYVESNTKDVHQFYEANKWLYASVAQLEEADADLDHVIARRSGLVEDFDEPRSPAAPAAKKDDDFPTGYFASPDGTMLGLRIISNTTLGAGAGDVLLAHVQQLIANHDPALKVGLTGDIASASDEKKALVSDAAWATIGALVVILVALVFYYRSAWALVVIAMPALFGISAAYAFAAVTFGYVNTCGAFLGAIILGNGINYPIVLLSRYREFVARGIEPAAAMRISVLNALRAELVGACVASIAYGSLFATRFRGFNQFGAIGFVGMLAVWVSIVPLVPALVVIGQRLALRLPARFRPPPAVLGLSRSPLSLLASVTARHPLPFVIAGIAIVSGALAIAPRYLRDPWEYDLGKLGSKSSDRTGAGEWSNKANVVFGGKMNIAGARMLADTPEQVPLLRAQMLANDARDPRGPMIAEITTLGDLLPSQQTEKLAVIERIRDRLTPHVRFELTEKERADLEPLDHLRALGPKDLPPLLRRRFTEADGREGTVFYVKPKNDIVFADGHNHLRFSRTTDNVELPNGERVLTASRSTIFAEMLESIRRDGPRASALALLMVICVVLVASRGPRYVLSVLGALAIGVSLLVTWAALFDVRINYVNFIALPITLGIGCEYPFNLADRARLLDGDAAEAVRRSAGAVLMCSFTTVVGYGSLVFSDFQALEGFGRLAVVGELGCVFGAVFFVPALLHALGGYKMKHARSHVASGARDDVRSRHRNLRGRAALRKR